jgi:hypothetical protein
MRNVGFSTGALALGNIGEALGMMKNKRLQAVELSALRQHELAPLVSQLDNLDLSRFTYVSVHAPSSIDPDFESEAVKLLEPIFDRGWPIIIHPDAMHQLASWEGFGDLLFIENMDKRKPIGQTANDLVPIFDQLPDAMLCFDLGHARQVDPTMSEASAILNKFKTRLKQLHVSEVNSQSKHGALTLEAIMAFRRVAPLIAPDVPAILESRVAESEIEAEVRNALAALDPGNTLAMAGD